MNTVWNDIRSGVRGFAKSPGFTAVVILTLALGIGAITTIFSVMDSVLLHPFPYKDAGRLATVSIALPDTTINRFPVRAFLDFKEQNHTFEDMIGLAYISVRYASQGATERVWGGWVTPDTFDVLGMKPLFGRPGTLEDAKPGSPPVFLMSYQLWATRFGRNTKLLGTTLNLNGAPRTLIGVMPPQFRFGDCDIWIPIDLNRNTFITGYGITENEVWTVGHLKRGVSSQAAEADLEVIAKKLETVYPTYFRSGYRLPATTLTDYFVGRFKFKLFALLAAVLMLLMIACSNAANLLLARAADREREMVIRASMGASRGALMQRLFVESLMLATVSCIAGCVLAYWGLKAVVWTIPTDALPSEVVFRVRLASLFFTMGVAVVTTLLCGLAPAIHVARQDLRAGLVGAGKGTDDRSRHGKLRSGLVIAEVAVSIVLLVGTGLMVRSLRALERVDLGFDPTKILYLDLALPEGRYDRADQKKVLFRKLLDHIHAIPGVLAATEADYPPPYSWGWTKIQIPGKTHAESWGTTFVTCSEGYFDTFNRHLLSGRLLTQNDIEAARLVTVVNQTFARLYFANENPVGKTVRFPTFEMYADWPRNAYFEIVGIVADAQNHGLQDPPRQEVYLPDSITGTGPRMLMVKSVQNSIAILPNVQREIAAADTDVAVAESGTLEDFLKQWYYADPQFLLITLGTFAATGLLLVTIGVFSVMAYAVATRTREFGIRMALGAQRGDVLRMVLKHGAVLISTGTAIGLLMTVALKRVLASEIWGVSSTDPWTFAAVIAILAATGTAACILPALRASSVETVVALRYE